MSKLTREEAREILQAYAEWAQALRAWSGTWEGGVYIDVAALEAEKDRTFEVLYGFYSSGKIRDFHPDDKGIVWNEEDEEEYGMLSNIALSLQDKPKGSLIGSEVVTGVWSKALLKEFNKTARINNLTGGK